MSNKMKPCKTCGQLIAKNAKNCPFCGAKNKKNRLGLLIIVIAVVAIALISNTNEKGTSHAEKDSSSYKGNPTFGTTESSKWQDAEDITPSAETTPPTETAIETQPTEQLINGMRPEIKDAIDSYEDFFEEYCAFMEKYQKNPYDTTLLTQYANFMAQYSETMQKMESMSNSDLNNAELQYYTEVSARITQMLYSVTG